MKRLGIVLLVGFGLLLATTTSAAAAVCVEVDEEEDTLADDERRAVRVIVENALSDAGKSISRTDCDATYTAYNVQIGNAVVAHLRGPEGRRQMKANSVEELPEVYSQLATALIEDEPVGQMSANRDTVTEQQADPNRVQSDHIFYVTLGYGLIFGGDIANGPAPAIGWRYELDNWAIDVTALRLIIGLDNTDGFNGSILRIGGEYFFDGTSAESPYFGVALSYGATHVVDNGVTYSDGGLQTEVNIGYEFLRTSDIRFFVELNGVIPFYAASVEDEAPMSAEDSTYTPSAILSVGAGF